MDTTSLELDCPLTDAEVQERTKRMLEALDEADQIERVLAAAKEDAKFELKVRNEIVRKMRRVISERSERRQVTCTVVPDWNHYQMRIVRDDTGEVVKVRPMSDEERQTELPSIATAKRRRSTSLDA